MVQFLVSLSIFYIFRKLEKKSIQIISQKKSVWISTWVEYEDLFDKMKKLNPYSIKDKKLGSQRRKQFFLFKTASSTNKSPWCSTSSNRSENTKLLILRHIKDCNNQIYGYDCDYDYEMIKLTVKPVFVSIILGLSLFLAVVLLSPYTTFLSLSPSA